MNQVSSINSNVAQPSVGFDQSAISMELEAVLEALHPRKDGAKQIEKGKVTEEMLYAAFAVSELRTKNPTLAASVLKDLQSHFKKFKESGDPKPIFKAIEKSLEGAVKKGALTKAEAKDISAKSLGMAQVDNRHDRLGSRYIKFVDKGEVPQSTTYMDRMVNTVANNSSASATEIKEIKASFERMAAKGVTYGPEDKKVRKVIYQGTEPVKETPKTTTTETKKVEPENDKSIKPSDGSEVVFGKYDFGYKPISSKTQMALVQIPSDYAKEASQVEILDAEGNVLATAPVAWEEADGRRYARFDKPGMGFGAMFNIRVTFTSGKTHTESIQDSSKVYSRDW